MTKALKQFTQDVKCACVCSIKEIMRKLFFLLITPILCFSSLVLVIHDFLPSLWRKCIRPTVANMRKLVSNEFIQRRSTKERKRRSYKFFFSVFEKRRFAIIRLIRLVSELGSTTMRNESLIVDRKGVCICG